MSRAVARNAGWNVAGNLSTAAVGLVALPVLLHALGAARLGIFTLALGLIGFSGLLDLGLSRSLTQGVSSALGRGRAIERVSAFVWRLILLLAGFGFVWLVLIWPTAPFVTERFFSLHGQLANETVFGLRAVALSIPFALVSTGAIGSLEGLQRFREISICRSFMSVLQFGLPTIAALWRPNVGLVIAALAASRVAGTILWLSLLHRTLPASASLRSESEDLNHLLRFGGWLSVSNLIGPLMGNVDRLYLASLLPPASVAAYAVSYDTLFRITTVPFAAAGAMFPALAEAQSSPESTVKMVRFAISVTVVTLLPPLFLASIFAKPLLTLWVGAEFAQITLPTFQILIVGVFLSCTAHVPYALLHALGRSDVTAKLHLIELPVFIGLLIFGVCAWGVAGAALATSLRVALDTIAAYTFSWTLHPQHRRALTMGVGIVILGGVALVMSVLDYHPVRITFAVLIAVTACFLALHSTYPALKELTRGRR